MREIAGKERRRFCAVLEGTIEEYVENRRRERLRHKVVAHYRDSVERNLMSWVYPKIGETTTTHDVFVHEFGSGPR